jgi:hypothetical protein
LIQYIGVIQKELRSEASSFNILQLEKWQNDSILQKKIEYQFLMMLHEDMQYLQHGGNVESPFWHL